MIRGAMICSDQEIAEDLGAILHRLELVGIVRFVSHVPDPGKVAQFIKATAPEMVFLGMEQGKTLPPAIAAIVAMSPNCQLVGVARRSDKTISRRDAQAMGMAEFLSFPFDDATVQSVLQRVRENLNQKPVSIRATDNVFSFLPAKPGVGASTLAANTAMAASRLTADRSFLLDCDRNNGIIRFLLQLENPLSLVDAIKHAFELDESVWQQLVTTLENLDVLHAGPVEPEMRVETVHLRQILNFARRFYDAVFVDLSGELERFAVEVMSASKRIFLVVTPELASIHMSREKLRYLNKLGLDDRVEIVLNRSQKRTVVNKDNVEELLRRPILIQFPNDYQRVNFAVTTGREIDPTSDLGKQLQAFASSLVDRAPRPNVPKMSFKDLLFSAEA